MKKKKIYLIITSIFILTGISLLIATFIHNNKNNNLVDGDTDFNYAFLKIENENKNIIYSPLSIKYALKMLESGASDKTYNEINNVIGNVNINKYSNNDKLSLANSIFIRNEYKNDIKEDYKNDLINNYNAEVIYDSFNNATNINNWIEEKTFKQIKNILSDDIVHDPSNYLMLVNALAIDMKWASQFEDIASHDEDFYINDKVIKVKMMNNVIKDNSASYLINEDITALSLDLEEINDNQFEFIAIMPNDINSFINNISEKNIVEIIDNLKQNPETGLDITIPKFSFDYSLKLKEDLKQLGINEAFNPENNDFKKISSSQKVFVSDAIHKANIDLNESGVKAAAVTVLIMKTTAIIEETKPIEIKLNKPFIFIIREKNNKDIWFVGEIFNPNEKDN